MSAVIIEIGEPLGTHANAKCEAQVRGNVERPINRVAKSSDNCLPLRDSR